MKTDKKRLVGDRYRRVLQIAEEIARNPGWARVSLSNRFHLSERQIQSDLDIIKRQLALPLVRQQGYRFASEGERTADLRTILTMVLLVEQARLTHSLPVDVLEAHARTIPSLVPAHLVPVAEYLVSAVLGRPSARKRLPLVLAETIVRGRAIRVTLALGHEHHQGRHLDVQPEALVRVGGVWHLLGDCEQTKSTRLIPLEGIATVTLAEAAPAEMARMGRAS